MLVTQVDHKLFSVELIQVRSHALEMLLSTRFVEKLMCRDFALFFDHNKMYK